ncbi:RNA polymerase sigma factor [Thermanaerothrix sp. 4228-RoL]|uniref:RNA polymerase sigma factor n=1 Tax=Thermanaerothrix solaris TaxID=3058434 RepID=A0ABU3NQQ8_9CHLR|nr:RNA polymerase sigma factor [Thermanaerothrix sp. 4228-RoL]MDT8898548.1 RNA polymerase sigma factor [Thermanaerothrix sp. 4228-RoL]
MNDRDLTDPGEFVDPTVHDDVFLIHLAQRDPSSFSLLYRKYVERVFRYIYSRVGQVPEAEDLTAQTFLSALENFPRFRNNGSFAAWLFAIARSKVMDYFRRQRSTPLMENLTDSNERDLLSEVIHSERVATLSKLIANLPEEERELLRLRFLGEMTYAEMAQVLHRSESAVKKATQRTLARLQAQMEVYYE